MAVDFTKPDGFDPAKGYKRIKFGEDGGITESELAELQKIQDQRLRDTMEAFIGRVTALLSGTITFNGSTLTATSLVGYLDGELFQYSGNIALVNNDRVYVEILESEITYAQDPSLLDSRMTEETTRRIKNTYSLKKTNTGAGKYFELGQIVSGIFVETAGRITPYADLGTDDINVIASKPSATLLSAYPYGVTVFKYLTGDAGYPVTNSTIMTFNNAQATDGFQVLYGYVSGKPVQYVRYFTGTVWGAWEKFATTADLTAHANDAVAHITATERTKWNDGQLQKLTELGGYSLSANNMDLNNLKTTGFYYGSSLVNAPGGTSGWILVHAVSQSYLVQEFTVNTNTAIGVRRFWRVFFNGTWLSWNEYALNSIATQSSNGLMSSLDKIALDGAQKFRLTKDNGEIQYPANNVDFNTINTTGYYAYIGTNGHTGAPNAWGYWFVHVVQYDANTGFQRWERTDTGDTHYRLRRNGVWGDFRKFVNSLEIGNIVSGGDFTDSFKTNLVGKVPGSNVVNSNIAKRSPGGALNPSDSNWIEAVATGGTGYERLQSVDGISFTQGASVAGQVASHLFSFNLIDNFQRIYGNIPGVTTADKILWLRNNISRITFEWTGFSTSPTGNKSSIARYDLAGFVTPVTSTSTSPAKVIYSVTLDGNPNRVSDFIRGTNDGMVHFVAYAEQSDGTVSSVINTDFVELTIELSTGILDGLLDATPTVRGIMSATDKAKLDGVANNANNYSHPSTHPATMIVEDSGHRFITDAERTTWNGKANNVVATQSLNGLMSATDKTKMDGIQAGAKVNQNAFSYMSAGGVTIQADNEIDTVAFLAGTNIALAGDSTNDTITISVTGTVASAAVAPWGGITGKPTKVEDFGITDVTLRYASAIQGQNWSRILEMNDASVFGHNYLVTVKGTRNSVVYKATLLVTTGHSSTCQITQLGNINYSDVQFRGVVDANGNGYLEMLDNLSGIVAGTSQAVSVEVIKIQDTNLVPIRTYQSGVTIPVNYNERGLMTTVKNKSFVGDLVGDVTGNATGNSGSATKLQTARSIALSGDATGSITFDGTGNVTIPVVVQDDSHNHVISNVDGLQTALNAKDSITSVDGKVAQARTDLEGYVEGYTKVAFKDTRDVNSPPSFYTGAEGRKTHFEFKDKTVIGLGVAAGAWISLITHSRWSESSGGNPSQTAIDDIGEMYMRVRINDTTWSNWRKFAFDETATTSTKGLMSNTDKSKLDGIATGANNYVHPSTHPASMIVQDVNNRFVTDAEKATWNAKEDAPQVKSFTTPATAGWYRIATTGININRNAGRFELDWGTAGSHGQINFTAGIMFGIDPTITQTMYSNYNASTGIKRARIVYHAVYANNYAYLEVYNETALSLTFTTKLYSALGWTLINPVAGAIPSGYSVLELPFADGIVTDSQLVSRLATGTAPLQVSSTTVVPNLNADLLDGAHAGTGANNVLKLDGSGKASPNIITQDANNRFSTDAEKASWTAKETPAGAQAKADNAQNVAIGFVKGYGLGAEATAFPTSDWNNITAKTGFYNGASMANSPKGNTGWHYVIHIRHANETGYISQIAIPFESNGQMFFRACNGGVWSAWTQNAILDSNGKVAIGNLALDSSNRLVTDTEKNTWNGKASTAIATTSANGLMSSADKTKLDGVATGANNYVHPADHPASMIVQSQSYRFVSDIEKSTWNGKANNTLASTFADGLMSKTQVTDLMASQKYKLMEDTGTRFQYNDLNFANFEGLFYAPTGTANSAVSYGAWVDVKVSPGGVFILQTLYANGANKRQYVRRSSNSGGAWDAWAEVATAELEWITATLQAGHTSLASRPVKYARDGNLLYIRGGIAKDGVGSLGTEANPIFTLPAGFRPKTTYFASPAMIGTGATSNYNNRFEVQTNGTVNMAFTWQCANYGIDTIIPLD